MSKKCTNCKIENTKGQKQTETKNIPLVSAECEATRQHKIICRLIWVVVLLTVLLFGSNLAWTVYEKQFDTVTETYDIDLKQDTENGNNNCIVNGGGICNGTAESTY